jgi:hypothetical protein
MQRTTCFARINFGSTPEDFMRQSFDPLKFIPPSDAIQKHLTHAVSLVKRLRILLRVAKSIEAAQEQPDIVRRSDREGVRHAD